MSLALFVYLANITTPIIIVLLVVAFIMLGYIFFNLMDLRPGEKLGLSLTFKVVLALVITMAILIPSERTMYRMAAAYGIEQVATHPKTAETADKLYRIINKELDKQLAK